jgi:hypothetical protein
MSMPDTREFAHIVSLLNSEGSASFMDIVAADKARGDLDLFDQALHWLVNNGHARYDCEKYHAETSLRDLRDRLPNATIILLREP